MKPLNRAARAGVWYVMKEGQDKAVVSIAYHLSHFISSKNKVRIGPAALSEPFHAAAELGRGHSSLPTPLSLVHTAPVKAAALVCWVGGQVQKMSLIWALMTSYQSGEWSGDICCHDLSLTSAGLVSGLSGGPSFLLSPPSLPCPTLTRLMSCSWSP